MARREFLMLSHPYKGENIGSWYWSEKCDGMRAYYDGGITRGKLAADVPFANTTKDARYKSKIFATGLWTRYGKPIQAPDWFLDKMPPYPLDGELYMGRGLFQSLMSTVKTLVPGPDWRQVRYMAFDSPPYHSIFANGEIDNTNFKKRLSGVIEKLGPLPTERPTSWDFHSVYQWLRERGERNEVFNLHEQNRLHWSSSVAQSELSERLADLVSQGAEGIMLRNPSSFWAPQRARTILKVKGMLDAEAEVIGYTWGRETDKGSKLLGKMGALVVRFRGKVFELSGFTDDERGMRVQNTSSFDSAYEVGVDNPGKPVEDGIYNPSFPRGSLVSFKYRELTLDGIPKEARYWRRYEE